MRVAAALSLPFPLLAALLLAPSAAADDLKPREAQAIAQERLTQLDGAAPAYADSLRLDLAEALEALEMPHAAQMIYVDLVRGGPRALAFESALLGLVRTGEAIDDDTELARVASRIPEDAAPDALRDQLTWQRALKLWNEHQLSSSVEELAKIPEGGEWSRRARALEGVIATARSQPTTAGAALQAAYEAPLPERSQRDARADAESVRYAALLNIARLHYAAGQFDRAAELYAGVPADSAHCPPALLEGAWSLFMLNELDGALALLDELDEREDRFLPERHVLRGLIAFNGLEYDLVESELLAFEAEHEPLEQTIRASLSPYDSPEGVKLVAGLWQDWFEDGTVDAPDALRAELLNDRVLGGLAAHIEQIRVERERALHRRVDLSDELEASLIADLGRYQTRAGRRLAVLLAEQADELKDLRTQSEIIRFEIVSASRMDYDYRMATPDMRDHARQRAEVVKPQGALLLDRKRASYNPLITTPDIGGRVAARPAGEPVRDREGYQDYGINPTTLAADDPHSTFSIDVDTASYTLSRRKLQGGQMPPEAAVRVEEFVNYFDYGYAGPDPGEGAAPFAVHLEAAPHPWRDDKHLLRVGVQARGPDEGPGRAPVRLHFLVDTSGSMNSADKLELAKRALHHLTDQLGPEDMVSLCTYAGNSRVVLEPTPLTSRSLIHDAIEALSSGGGTAMAGGVENAYRLAAESYVEGVENRVIVLSDGDANIGPTDHEQILRSVERYASEGITLSTVGFGSGNYQDAMMEQLANKGDGNYFYIDGMREAKKVFGQELSGTIRTVARDVKIQVEFNPDVVHAYRLVGYENRDIADEDFRDDAVDAGEIGEGHRVTAIYELVLSAPSERETWGDAPMAVVRLRAKPPGKDRRASEWETAMPARAMGYDFDGAAPGFRQAVAVAGFAQKLRSDPSMAEVSWQEIADVLGASADLDRPEIRELLDLIDTADRLSAAQAARK